MFMLSVPCLYLALVQSKVITQSTHLGAAGTTSGPSSPSPAAPSAPLRGATTRAAATKEQGRKSCCLLRAANSSRNVPSHLPFLVLMCYVSCVSSFGGASGNHETTKKRKKKPSYKETKLENKRIMIFKPSSSSTSSLSSWQGRTSLLN